MTKPGPPTMHYRPADISLPDGWTWERVEAQRAQWNIGADMVPIATAGGAVAWGTINSVRQSNGQRNYEADCARCPNYSDGTKRKAWHDLEPLFQSTWLDKHA